MQLNYQKSGANYPLIILHGLFGMLDNWKSVAKELEKNFTVYLIDQRNHGKSPHTDEHTYQLMADDLHEFFQQQQISSAHILGHSMGGKTAMQFAFDYPGLVNKLIVVDMGMKRYPPGHDEIFDALHSIDLSHIHFRADAEKILLDKISDYGVRQFILKNLTRNTDGTYSWKFNLAALSENYETGILAPVISDHPFNGKTLFIRGEYSNYILNEDRDAISAFFPDSKLVTIRGAGHWVHADRPNELIREINNFL